jgi:hypothetical protein
MMEPRPVRSLHLQLTLDQRESEQGKLSLDINAKAEGLIPDLNSIFESVEVPGFDLSIADQPNSVTEFKSTDLAVVAASERNWQLTFRRRTDFYADTHFRFPRKLAALSADIDYKRFADADLISVSAQEATAGFLFSRSRDRATWWTLMGIISLISAAAGSQWWRRVRSADKTTTVSGRHLPEIITPFTTLSFLRRAKETSLSATERDSIAAAIQALEERCFSVNPHPPGKAELRSLMHSLTAHASVRAPDHEAVPLED